MRLEAQQASVSAIAACLCALQLHPHAPAAAGHHVLHRAGRPGELLPLSELGCWHVLRGLSAGREAEQSGDVACAADLRHTPCAACPKARRLLAGSSHAGCSGWCAAEREGLSRRDDPALPARCLQGRKGKVAYAAFAQGAIAFQAAGRQPIVYRRLRRRAVPPPACRGRDAAI